MHTPSWIERASEESANPKPVLRTPFADTKKTFAVDASGSTAGSIMASQADSVHAIRTGERDVVCKWDHSCEIPRLLDEVPSDYFSGNGGTYPACIMGNRTAVEQIQDSDLWILLTDGEIYERDVTELTRLAEEMTVTQVPVILLITGYPAKTPARANISVGISFFASAPDALILFKDFKKGVLYVIDAKGAFAGLKGSADVDLSDWKNLPNFKTEEDLKAQLRSANINFDQNRSGRNGKGISLGPNWDVATDNSLVKVSELLNQERLDPVNLRVLLEEQTLEQLALTCKTRGQLNELRNLLIRHKQQEVTVRLEDRHGAGDIMRELQATQDLCEKTRLSEDLRHAHIANRATYLQLKDTPTDEAKKLTTLNRLIDGGLRIISGFEKSSYTADILSRKSNRAMRAGMVTAADREVRLAALDLSDDVKAFRSACPICCGEREIMSIVTKVLEERNGENTSDFSLNFPLAAGQTEQNAKIISSQCICF